MPTTMINLEGQEWIIEVVNNIIIEVLSSVAEQERQETRKRQAEGITAARKRGQHLGRQEIDFPPNWFEVYIRWKKKEIRANTAMEILNLKRTTFYKLVNKYEQENKWNIILMMFDYSSYR